MHRLTIAKIEKGERRARNTSIEELFALALALGVSPLHLVVPVDDAGKLAVTPSHHVGVRHARAWLRGRAPLREEDIPTFVEQMPASEQKQLFMSVVEQVDPIAAALLEQDKEEEK